MIDKAQVVFRIERESLKRFDRLVEKAGVSREEALRTLCEKVAELDIKPSETCLYKAYR